MDASDWILNLRLDQNENEADNEEIGDTEAHSDRISHLADNRTMRRSVLCFFVTGRELGKLAGGSDSIPLGFPLAQIEFLEDARSEEQDADQGQAARDPGGCCVHVQSPISVTQGVTFITQTDQRRLDNWNIIRENYYFLVNYYWENIESYLGREWNQLFGRKHSSK